MDINVKVKIESPELMNAVLALAEALQKGQHGESVTKKDDKVVVARESVDIIKNNEEKVLALEDVRKKLASLSQAGKQKEVKALITKYGANKLTDINPSCYENLLKDAEVL